MAHQESVLSPETDLLILVSARPYTALLMTLCHECAKAHIHESVHAWSQIFVLLCLLAKTF